MQSLALVFTALLASSCWTHAAPSRTSSVATFHAEDKAIAAGKSFTVALQLAHPDGWHSYYQHSGGVELPPAIAWKLPEGFIAGPIQWPVPEVKDGYFGKSFVYPGSPVFLVDLMAPASLEAGKTITLTADATWQICKESCINEEKSFTLTLPVAAAAEKNESESVMFQKARDRQPASITSLKTTAQSDGGDIQLRIEPASALKGEPTDFIPNQAFLQPASAGGNIKRDADAWLVTLKRIKIDAFDNSVSQGKSISGILAGPSPLAIPATIIGNPPAKPLPFSKYLPILGGMLLGGLILNLMPCVFPVIGLKIMSFVQQAGDDRRKIALHGVMFATGVLASFGVISGILFGARAAAGSGAGSIGWAISSRIRGSSLLSCCSCSFSRSTC